MYLNFSIDIVLLHYCNYIIIYIILLKKDHVTSFCMFFSYINSSSLTVNQTQIISVKERKTARKTELFFFFR